MTFELPKGTSYDVAKAVEDIHSDLGTEHGRDGVLITVDDEEKIHIEIEDGIGAM